MPKPTLAGKLVVAIQLAGALRSHREPPDLHGEGVDAYHRYQLEHENEILAAGRRSFW
jgi:hypothetical protein